MSKLLLDDKPLIILPSLAAKIGLNESIVLQQLHYWLLESKNIRDGHKWVYNTYEDWQKQFPFWSVRTLKRIITGLEKDELIFTSNFNKLKIDRTKWYRINHEKLDSIVEHPEGQGGTSIVTEWHDGEDKMTPPLPEITTETTTDNIYIVFQHWNSKKIITHKSLNDKMKSHINARLENYNVDELLKAVDNFNEVITNDLYYWTHRWTLQDFMKPNNVVRFLDSSKPFETFSSNKNKSRSTKESASNGEYKKDRNVVSQISGGLFDDD